MENRLYLGLNNLKEFYLKNKIVILSSIILLFLGIAILIALIPNVFAQPVKSVEIISDSVSFEEKDPGAWKVDKSAKWIGKGEAEITFDGDSIMKSNNKYSDVLFVLDVSGSMDGDKLNRVKADSIELIESLLSNGQNKAGLITFDSTSNIVLDFTKDEELLKEKVNSLTTTGCTNYYQALVNVDEVLKNYKKEKDRECIVLFLTDGYPNEDIPNEETQYSYLRQQYPFITINGIQYEMGTNVLDPVKNVTDNQFIADMDTLNNVLFDASVTPITYDEFSITDYIDTNYFYVESENDIKVTHGNVTFDKDAQTVNWFMDKLRTGQGAKMTIKAKLREEFIGEGGFYPTNIKEEIKNKLDEAEESIDSNKTPVLANNHKVIYDGNAPAGCNVKGVPETSNHSVFDTVGISEASLKCKGYQFRGWEAIIDSVNWLNDDYFTMPEKDVVIRAKWGKLSIDKAMDGEVHEYIPATLEHYTSGSIYGLHKYESSITDMVFQDTMSKIGGAVDVLDISAEKNNGILAYIVPNEDDSTKYTAYIQGDGSVIANSNSENLFRSFTNLKSIENLAYLDTSKVTNMSSMFGWCRSLTSLDLSDLDTSNVKDMSDMFSGCSSLTSLDLSSFDTSNVTSFTSMFWKCDSLTSLDLSNFNTSSATDMGHMFNECSSLTSIGLSNFDTSSVTNMSFMFDECSSLTSIDLSNFDTSSVTNMGSMFSGCSGLTSLDLINFDTSSVTVMRYLFSGCSGLTSLDLSNFDTSSVTTMREMFSGCSSLTSLNLSSFDTSSVTEMHDMFYNCSGLTSIDLSKFDTSSVTTMIEMFYGCRRLASLDLSNFDTSSVTSMSHMFYNCKALTSLDLSNFDTSSVTTMDSMFLNCSSLKSLDLSKFDTSSVTNMREMFYGCRGLTSLDLSNFDTSSVTNMIGMFRDCRLTSLDLSSFDTSKVTDMSYMFRDCSGLTSLDLSNFDISSVTNMSEMFRDCRLTSLDLSSFDTSSVTNMSYMFNGCVALTSLDLGKFNTSSVTDMSYIFNDCSKLISLNLSSFDTSKVTKMVSMFYGCSSLTSLDLSKFDTSKVTTMYSMFNKCSSLKSLNLSNFDTSKVTNMVLMFSGCKSLTSLDLSNFDTSKVTDMTSMFNGCSSLTSLDLSKFDTSNVTDMGYMFNGCSSLTSLDLSKFDTSKVTRMRYMFYDCSGLISLDLSSFDTSSVTDMSYMFENCHKLSTTLTVAHKLTVLNYLMMFSNAATADGAQITVNYTEAVADEIDSYIATKSNNSNVVKGELVTV